jgi:hypothetical protein
MKAAMEYTLHDRNGTPAKILNAIKIGIILLDVSLHDTDRSLAISSQLPDS